MDEMVWIFWVVGLAFIVGGVLMYRHRRFLGSGMRKFTPVLRGGPEGPLADGSLLIIPAVFAPPMGVFFLFYAASETFGWG